MSYYKITDYEIAAILGKRNAQLTSGKKSSMISLEELKKLKMYDPADIAQLEVDRKLNIPIIIEREEKTPTGERYVRKFQAADLLNTLEMNVYNTKIYLKEHEIE